LGDLLGLSWFCRQVHIPFFKQLILAVSIQSRRGANGFENVACRVINQKERIGFRLEQFAIAFLALPQRLLPALTLGDVHYRRATYMRIFGKRGFDPHEKRLIAFFQERHLADLFGLSLKYLLEAGFEGRTEFRLNKAPKRLAHQPVALDTEEASAGKVGRPNGPVPVEGKVAHRGKFVEVGVFLQPCLDLLLGLPELFVLQFQLNLVDLQFAEEPLLVCLFPGAARFRRFLFQSLFREAA